MIEMLSEPKLYNIDQSWNYETLWKITNNKSTLKVKIEIRRNAYDFQSWGRAYLFEPDRLQWNCVADTAGPELKCLGLSYAERDKLKVTRDHLPSLRLDVLILMQEVCRVVDVPVPVDLPKGPTTKSERKRA